MTKQSRPSGVPDACRKHSSSLMHQSHSYPKTGGAPAFHGASSSKDLRFTFKRWQDGRTRTDPLLRQHRQQILHSRGKCTHRRNRQQRTHLRIISRQSTGSSGRYWQSTIGGFGIKSHPSSSTNHHQQRSMGCMGATLAWCVVVPHIPPSPSGQVNTSNENSWAVIRTAVTASILFFFCLPSFLSPTLHQAP